MSAKSSADKEMGALFKREMSKYPKRGIKQQAVIFHKDKNHQTKKKMFKKISLSEHLDSLKKCADGKLLMEETFGSMASGMSHLPQEFVSGQMQLPNWRGGKQ